MDKEKTNKMLETFLHTVAENAAKAILSTEENVKVRIEKTNIVIELPHERLLVFCIKKKTNEDIKLLTGGKSGNKS